MSPLAHFSSPDLKLVYRVLHRALLAEPDLMDSALLAAMQTLLQERARADGVDTSDHGAWDAWLGKPPAPQRGALTLLEGGRS